MGDATPSCVTTAQRLAKKYSVMRTRVCTTWPRCTTMPGETGEREDISGNLTQLCFWQIIGPTHVELWAHISDADLLHYYTATATSFTATAAF